MTGLDRLKRHRRNIAVGWLVAALVFARLAMKPAMPVAWLYGFSGFCWGILVTTWLVLGPGRNKEGAS